MGKSPVKVNYVTGLTGHQNPIFTIENSQKKGILFSAGNDKGVVEWSVKDPAFIKVMFPVKTSVYALHCPENYPILLSGERSGSVGVFNFIEQKITNNLEHHKLPIFDIKSAPGKREILIASEDGTVSVWSLDTYKLLYAFPVSRDTVRVISISPDESTVAFGCKDASIRIFSMKDFSLMHVIHSHSMPVTALQYSPDGAQLLSGSRDAQLKIWDAKSFQEIQSVPAHLFAVYSIAFHPRLPVFATASRDKTIKIWDTENYSLLKTISIDKGFESHRLSINKIIWSNWNNELISAGDDKEIKIWEINLD